MAKAPKGKPRWLGPRETKAMGLRHRNLVQNARRAISRGETVPWVRKRVRDDGKEVWQFREDALRPPESPHIPIKEAASLADVTAQTINRWYDAGDLPADKEAEKEAGHRRLLRKPFMEMLPRLRERGRRPHALSTQDPEHLGATEAARILGRGKEWVYQRIRDGSIPSVRAKGSKGRRIKIPRETFMELVPSMRRKGKRAKRNPGEGAISKREARGLLGFKTNNPLNRLIDEGHIEVNERGRILREPFIDGLRRIKRLIEEPSWKKPGMATSERAAEILGCNTDTVHRLIENGEVETREGPDWVPGRPRMIPEARLRREAPRLRKLIRTHYSKRDPERISIGEISEILPLGRMGVQEWIDNGIIPSITQKTRKKGERRAVNRAEFMAHLPRLLDMARERLSTGRTPEQARVAWERSLRARRRLLETENNGHSPILKRLIGEERLSPEEAGNSGIQHNLLQRELERVGRMSESEVQRRAGMPRRQYVAELLRQSRLISAGTPVEG